VHAVGRSDERAQDEKEQENRQIYREEKR